jgi:hypothetical protein
MARGSKYERRTSFTAPGIKSYTWRTERFSRVRTKVLYSDVFEAGGYKWYCAYTFPQSIHVVRLSILVDMLYCVIVGSIYSGK